MKLTRYFFSLFSAISFATIANAASLHIEVAPGVDFSKISAPVDATLSIFLQNDSISTGFVNKQLSDEVIEGITPIANLEQFNDQIHGGGLLSLIKYSFDITDDNTGATYYHCSLVRSGTPFIPDKNYYLVITGLQSNDCKLLVE